MKFCFRKFFYFLLLPLVLVSCEDEEKVCDDCQDAIDHMFHKIESNNCDPDLMGDAMTRLSDECGLFSGQIFAGFMAHSCANEDFTRRPECISVSDDIIHGHLKNQRVQVELRLFSTRNDDDSLHIELALSNGVADDALFTMKAGDATDYFIPSLEHGEVVDIIVSDIGSEEVIIQKSVNNKFWRSGYWTQIRSAQVQYIPLLDEYDVVFNYW